MFKMKNQYTELKKLDYDLYRETIDTAAALSINNKLNLEEAATLEQTLVDFILKVKSGWKNELI